MLVGRVRTGDPARPLAEAVAIGGGRVVAVGRVSELRPHRGPHTEVIGGRGVVIVPGFVDAHLHFLAFARRTGEVDCSAPGCTRVATILARLANAAKARSGGVWIRAFGYDEAFLAEKRPPSLAELDAAVPSHPLRLLHRTGHAALLNGAALAALGLESHDPRVERDPNGRPTGFVREPGECLRGRIPRPSASELAGLFARATRRLLEVGITTFHDPTPGQGYAEVGELRRLVEDGVIRQRVRVYGSAETLVGGFDEPAAERFALCGVKIVLADDVDADQFAESLAVADRRGAQVAVHAVEEGPLAVATDGLRRLGSERVTLRRHRIEHAALCPPALVQEIASSGAAVVTHPDFLTRFAGKYRAAIPAAQHDWLYPLRAYLDAGVRLAFGSDAPIAPPVPLVTIAAAVARCTGEGDLLAAGQGIPAEEALRLHTAAGAALTGEADRLGRLAPGAVADVVVLGADPTEVEPREIGRIEVRATIVDGIVEWAAS